MDPAAAPPSGSTEPDVEVVASARPASTPHPASGARTAVSASVMLKRWVAAGELRTEDAGLKVTQLNRRLCEAGVLLGEPGRWHPSPLAARIGVVLEARQNAAGETYQSLEFTPRMQSVLLDLYRDGVF